VAHKQGGKRDNCSYRKYQYHFVFSKIWLGGALILLKKNPEYSVDIATAHILQAELLVPTYFSLFAREALPRT